jgi:multiple sugar transport system substrate-binding protein
MSDRSQLDQMLSQRVSRRSVLKSAGVAALGVGGMASFLEACSNTSAAGGPVTLTYMNYQSDDSLTHYTPVFRAFEKAHPGTTVKTPNFPQGYAEKLNTLLASGSPPDLWLDYGDGLTLDQAAAGAVLDLTPYVSQFPILQETLPAVQLYWGSNKFEGSGYHVQSIQTFYSKSLFDKAGLPYPPATVDKAWSWDQFVEVAKKLTVDSKGVTADKRGFDPTSTVQFGVSALISDWWGRWLPFIWSAGADLVSRDGKKYTLNTPQGVTAIKLLADLINVHHVHPTPTVSAGLPGPETAIAQHRTAMIIDGQWTCGYLPPLTSDWGIGVLPVIKYPVTHLNPQSIVVSAKTPHPKESAELLAFYMDPRTNPVYGIGNIMPAWKNAYTDPSIVSAWTNSPARPPEYKTAVIDYVANYGVPSPIWVKHFSKILDATQAGLDPVWRGQQSAESALKSLGDTISPLLAGSYPAPPSAPTPPSG